MIFLALSCFSHFLCDWLGIGYKNSLFKLSCFNLVTEQHEDVESCTYMGVVELSNFDLLDNIPYESLKGEMNIYPYLTTIGQARVENIYPAPPQITKYVALVINNDFLNVDTKLTYSTNNNKLDKEYSKLLETIRENLYSL